MNLFIRTVHSQILFDALTGACADVTFHTLSGLDHFLHLTAFDPPYPAQTVQSTRNCEPVETTTGPPLTWDKIFEFFRSHLN